MKHTRLTTAAIALPLAVSLSACGSTGSSDNGAKSAGSAHKAAQSAAGNSSASQSSTSPSPSTGSTSTGSGSTGQSVDIGQVMTAAMKAQKQKGTVHIVATGGSATQSIKETGDVSYHPGKAPDMDMTMAVGAQHFSMLIASGHLYMSGMPGMPKGKYVSLDQASPMFGQMFNSLAQADPSKSMDKLKQATKSSKLVGTDTIDGVQTKHYRLTVSTQTMMQSELKKLPKKMRAMVQAQMSRLPKTITDDMWVGPDNLPRKIVTGIPNMGGTFTILMSKWGQPVHITQPKKSQVISMPGTRG